MDEFTQFLAWEQSSRDTIDVKRVYIDMVGDLAGGVLLSQIVFWHLLDPQTGQSKLRVERDGHRWLVKAKNEWWDECRISVKQATRIIPHLVELGLIETRVYRFNGDPTTHLRLVPEKLIALMRQYVEGVKTFVPKGNEPKFPLGTNDSDQRERTITETTSESTTEKKTTPPKPPSGGTTSEEFPEIPKQLRTPAFEVAWGEWLEYRRLRGKKFAVTPIGARKSFKKLVPFGPSVAVAAIEASIANGWQGLFPENVKTNSVPVEPQPYIPPPRTGPIEWGMQPSADDIRRQEEARRNGK